MYTSKSYNAEYSNNFLADRSVVISEAESELCKKAITIEECHLAVKQLKTNKTPGSDGFSAEFYQHFWDDINDIVFASLCKAYHNE